MKHHILIKIGSVALAITLIFLAVGPASAAANGPVATVNTGALNIRSGPSVAYGVLTSVYRGTVVTLLARTADSSWLQVMLANGTQGWVNGSYLATSYPIYSLPISGAVSSAAATVSTGALNIRSGPGIAYGVVTSVYRGTVVTLLARTTDNAWLKVALSTGAQGWVNGKYVTTSYPIYNLPVEGGVIVIPPTTARTHVVQWGDNLFRIALRYGVNIYTLAAANGITDISRIYAGQVLVIP